MKEYNEDEAVACMRAAIGDHEVNDDDIVEVLDLIFDYYDDNGELEIDVDDDADSDIEAMTDYVAKYLAKNDCQFSREEIERMVRAEIQYEESLF